MDAREELKRLLSEGIHIIGIRRGLTIAAVESHLGQMLGRNTKHPGSAIEYWRQGNVPASRDDVEGLARHMVEWGGLDQHWLEEFLTCIEKLRQEKLGGRTPSTAWHKR